MVEDWPERARAEGDLLHGDVVDGGLLQPAKLTVDLALWVRGEYGKTFRSDDLLRWALVRDGSRQCKLRGPLPVMPRLGP